MPAAVVVAATAACRVLHLRHGACLRWLLPGTHHLPVTETSDQLQRLARPRALQNTWDSEMEGEWFHEPWESNDRSWLDLNLDVRFLAAV